MPFIAKRGMGVAEGLAETITKKDDAATWTKRLAGRGDETIIVLVDGGLTIEQSRKNKLYTALREAEKVHEYGFGLMSERELELFVRQRAKAMDVQWEPAAIKAIVERVGADSWRLAQEVHKVSSFIKGDATVTASIVEQMVVPSFDDALFAFLMPCVMGTASSW